MRSFLTNRTQCKGSCKFPKRIRSFVPLIEVYKIVLIHQLTNNQLIINYLIESTN